MTMKCNFCFAQLCEKEQLIGLKLCQSCYGQLEFINQYKGNKCCNCQKKLISKEAKEQICEDCQYWENHLNQISIPNKALLYYNEFSHALMERLKFQGDILLWESVIPLFQMYAFFPKRYIQRIPSSDTTCQKRDFDHLAYILDMSNARTVDILTKKANIVSQVELADVHARRKLKNGFELKQPTSVGRLVLFDDVYTTGATLKDCVRILQYNNVIVDKTLTIFRSDLR